VTERTHTQNMAVFCDFENVALGVRDAKYARFDMKKVLERLLLKGNIVVKKAYADWERYKQFKAGMHEASFELIEIPHVRQSGKNSADIRMVVDALDLCYTKHHVDIFVVVSGDSDFSPLVSKLRENNKVVIGVGVKKSTSDLLIANCDEFIYYDDLVREEEKARATEKGKGARGGRKAKETKAATETRETEEAKEAEGTKKGRRPKRGTKASETEGAPAAPEAGEGKVAQEGQETPEKPKRTRRRAAKKEPAAEARLENGEPRGAEGAGAPETSRAQGRAAWPEAERSEHEAQDRKREEALALVMATVEDLFADRGAEEKVWGSMVKQTIKRRRPGFNERYHGFKTFAALLEEARDRGALDLEYDEKSGGYIIRRAARKG
jgi:uncharacterized protein (TIGR00288 family)